MITYSPGWQKKNTKKNQGWQQKIRFSHPKLVTWQKNCAHTHKMGPYIVTNGVVTYNPYKWSCNLTYNWFFGPTLHPIPSSTKTVSAVSGGVLPFLVRHLFFELFIALLTIALALALLPLDVAEGLARLADRVKEGPGNLKENKKTPSWLVTF